MMLIRKVTEDDAQAFLNMLLQLDRETKNMMYEPNERRNDDERKRNSTIKISLTGIGEADLLLIHI